jgi:hypothetical protein
MKTMTMALMLMSSSAFAENLNVNIQGFNFNYSDPKGSGSASSFARSGTPSLAGVNVNVEKIEDAFKISVTGSENQEMELKGAPDLIMKAQNIDISNFNLDLSSKASLSMDEGDFNSKDNDLKLKGFSLDCARDQAQAKVMDQLLSGCVQKMTLRSSDFSSTVHNSREAHALALLTDSIEKAISQSRGDTRVKSLKLNVAGGKYNLEANVQAEVSGKVTSDGNLSYDAGAGVLTLKISSVKFSILTVTSKVFDALKKKQSAKLKVKEPYVYFTVK